MKLRVDHLLVNVLDMDAAVHWYCDVLGMREASRTIIPLSDGSNIDNRVFEADGDTFSVVVGQPIEPWGLKAQEVQRTGPGVHHVAYEVDDLAATVAELKSKGVEFLTDEPTDDGGLRQIFTRKDPVTEIIHEFIQRTGGTRGFTSANMANLAEASTRGA